jgi:transposase
LAKIGDVSRFSSVEKLVAYAGIDASVYQTGKFEGQHSRQQLRGCETVAYPVVSLDYQLSPEAWTLGSEYE